MCRNGKLDRQLSPFEFKRLMNFFPATSPVSSVDTLHVSIAMVCDLFTLA